MSDIEANELTALLLNPSGRIIAWNERCDYVFGTSGMAVLRQPFTTLLAHTEQRQRFEQLFLSLRTNPCIQPESVFDAMLSDGSKVPCRFRLIPQLGRNGAFLGCILLAAQDRGDAGQVARLPLSTFRDYIAGPLYVIGQDGHIVLWNKHVERVTQLRPEELASAHAIELFNGTDRAVVAQKIQQVFELDAEVQVEASVQARDGSSTPFLFSGVRLQCGQTAYLVGMGIDLTERRQQEAMLRLRDRALHASSNGIVIGRRAGRDNPIEYVNPAFVRITGYTADEVIGRDLRFMAAPGLDEAERAMLRAAISEQREVRVVLRNLRKNGEIFWNELTITPVTGEQDKVSHFIGVINDVTATKQRTALLEHEVNHDALTGLANRNLMWDRLDQALRQAQRNKTLVATLLLDLNNFKKINDTLGHEAGDEVLTVVAKRLQAAVRDVDTVARLSGDEFVLVLIDQPSLRFTTQMIERLRCGLSKPVVFDSKEIPVSASIGVSLYPHDGCTVTELVHAADVAMYHAKQCGMQGAHYFSADMKSASEAKQLLETHLRSAVDKDEIELRYQPKLCLHSGKVVGIEALLRWRHPVRGLLLPEAFLADAEDNGAIIPIGMRVCELACELISQLRQCGWPTLPVSINVSYRELSQPDYIANIQQRLARYQIDPACLEIELREESMMRNPALAAERSLAIHDLGVRFAIDNFGAGQSNLACLEKLPIAHLNLSAACVRQIGDLGSNGNMAKTLIDIAHNLQFMVVAEGVETLAQANFLRETGCDQLQGSYFSVPLERAALDLLLSGKAAISRAPPA